jgi:hypothetical protein
MFNQEGSFTGTVTEVVFADPKFAKGPDDFDVCLHIVKSDDESQADWWRGEMSGDYGRGNFSTMKQCEITMQALHKVGFEGDDLTTLADQLVGKDIPFAVKKTEKDGKTFFNIRYIGAGGGDVPKPIEGDIKARMAALMGGGSGDAAPAEEATATTAPTAGKSNPFDGGAKKSPF